MAGTERCFSHVSGPSKDPDSIPAALVDVPMRPAVTRVSATGSSPPEGAHIGPASGGPDATFQRQTGGLVHALIRACEGQTVDSYRLEHLARELRDLGADTDHESDDDVVHIATRIYTKLVKREEMTSIAGQHRLWEVPFSYRSAQGSGPSVRAESVVLRGTIDCLARDSEGRVTVLELKTGRPRPEHQQQLDMYVAAARAMFPGSPVRGTPCLSLRGPKGAHVTLGGPRGPTRPRLPNASIGTRCRRWQRRCGFGVRRAIPVVTVDLRRGVRPIVGRWPQLPPGSFRRA